MVQTGHCCGDCVSPTVAETRTVVPMSTWFRVRLHLSVAMGLSMATSLGLLVVRYAATGRFGFRFLVWNLFLAAIPFPLALLAEWLLRVRQRVAALPVLAGWLLFLPNAPYLVTDILHVQRSDAPLWYDALLYGSFAVSGILLCFGSVALVHIAVRISAGQVAGWIAALMSLLLAGFGVYLGRVERWNSWNFWQTPRSLARSILEPVQNPLSNTRTIGFTVVYGAFLCVSYVSVAAIGAVLRELASVPERETFRRP